MVKAKQRQSSTNSKGKLLLSGAAGLAAAGVAGYSLRAVTTQDIQDFQPTYTVSFRELSSAKKTLATLPVRDGSEIIPDYDSSTMPSWYDADKDGCPTRYDVLTRDILNEKTDEANCKIISGVMFDYYTGSLVKYNRLVKGGGIDIDHVVAKGNAWVSGGNSWTNEQWKTYINDKDVLLATSAKANRGKGDKDAASWLPPNENFQCKYVIRQIQIKGKYSLNVSPEEKTAIENVLETNCKSE